MLRPRPGFDLFLISGLILFLELACIRWFPAHVLFLTFFTNTVLLACFVGMSIGCLLADRPTRLIDKTPLMLMLAMVAGGIVLLFRGKLQRHVDVAGQANPEVVFFGAESQSLQEIEFHVPVEVVMGLFFVLIALVMVGPGQEMGRAFGRVPSRAKAYALNLLGSLVGIGLFAAGSYSQLSPIVWFGLSALGLVYFLRQSPEAGWLRYLFLGLALLVTLPTSTLTSRLFVDYDVTWSPYYRIDYKPNNSEITTNLIGHQQIIPREKPAMEPYSIPYLLQRDTRNADGTKAWPEFKRILIIGAGSGNDLSRALYWTGPEARIDAVEIDPVIQSKGVAHNPDRPYQDSRVTVHLNDGRNFLRQAPSGEYDLVVFALVDSLVLHSGYSNLRLESFLFTTESMRDVHRVLKPTGVAAIYNYFRQGWIAIRLRTILRDSFGGDPVVLTDPPLDDVRMNQYDASMFTVFVCGTEPTVTPLRQAFANSGNAYWLPADRAPTHDSPARFQSTMPPPLPPPPADQPQYHGPIGRSKWIRLRAATVEEAPADLRNATDDWPFLYSRRPDIPGLTWRGMAIMVALSLGLWWLLSKKLAPATATATPDGESDRGLLLRSFLLGAGFMLIETKAVVQMALLFGSTWAVNTVVFAAILVMALVGNLFAAWIKPKVLWPYYVGLFAALALNVAVPLDAFLGLDRAAQLAASCALVFAPVAFAGVIFPTSFARSKRPDLFFGANVAGALAGGLAENLSMLLGFRYLLLVAVGLYAASALFGSRASAKSQ